jgi:hypothetical protein
MQSGTLSTPRAVDKQPSCPSCRRSSCRLWGRLGFKSRTEPAGFFSAGFGSLLSSARDFQKHTWVSGRRECGKFRTRADPSKCIRAGRFLIFPGCRGLPSTGARHAFCSLEGCDRTMPVWSCVSVLFCCRRATPQTETAQRGQLRIPLERMAANP